MKENEYHTKVKYKSRKKSRKYPAFSSCIGECTYFHNRPLSRNNLSILVVRSLRGIEVEKIFGNFKNFAVIVFNGEFSCGIVDTRHLSKYALMLRY